MYAEVFGDLQPGDDLAVLGARIGDRVLTERVFDDGTGFQPYGGFAPYCNDVPLPVDYALSVAVPPGSNDITFYARDLEGNTSEFTTTVLGPLPPGPVKDLRAKLVGPRQALVTWYAPNLSGNCYAKYLVTTRGYHPKSTITVPPSNSARRVAYSRLPVGWHHFTVQASNQGGEGPSRTVRLFVPRPWSGDPPHHR